MDINLSESCSDFKSQPKDHSDTKSAEYNGMDVSLSNPPSASPKNEMCTNSPNATAISARSSTQKPGFFYTKTNSPKKIQRWCDEFEQIAQCLIKKDYEILKEYLNKLTDTHFKSLLSVILPGNLQDISSDGIFLTLLDWAADPKCGSSTFFRFLFDRLSREELIRALAMIFYPDSNDTLWHKVCCVIDEELVKLLEQKLGMDTIVKMVTGLPNATGTVPLINACSTKSGIALFDRIHRYNPDVSLKLLKDRPDGDETVLQALCGETGEVLKAYCVLTGDEWLQRTQYLISLLNNADDRFDAIRFKGKRGESPLQWACRQWECNKLLRLLAEGFDVTHLARLILEGKDEGESLLQLALKADELKLACELCQRIRDPAIKFNVLSIGFQEGQSLLHYCQAKLENSSYGVDFRSTIDDFLDGLNDQHKNQLIAGGDVSGLKQEVECADHSIVSSFTTSIGRRLGFVNNADKSAYSEHLKKKDFSLVIHGMTHCGKEWAEHLLEKITDRELKNKMLLYRIEKGQSLLMMSFANGCFLRGDHMLDEASGAEKKKLASEIYQQALDVGALDYAYSLRYLLGDNDSKPIAMEGIEEGSPPLQVAVESETLDDDKRIRFLCKALENGLLQDQLLTNQLNNISQFLPYDNHPVFAKWVIGSLKDNQSPLDIVLDRYHLALVNSRSCSDRDHLLGCNILFETMLKALNQDQIKTFFLPSGNGVNNKLHLLGNIGILNAAVNALGESAKSIVEDVTKGAGHENLLHTVFKFEYVVKADGDDVAEMIIWLDDHYGLQAYLKAQSDKDLSTPLHRLFEIETSGSALSSSYRRVNALRVNMLKRIGRNDIHRKLLIECLKIANKKGETPLHQLFTRSIVSMKVVDCLFEVLKPEELSMLMNINDQKGKSAMDYCREKHNYEYSIILQRVQNKV